MAITYCATAITSCASTRRGSYWAPRRAVGLKERGPGHRIRWPNDITLDGDGGFYFTESIREEGAVIHVDAAGSARGVARDIDFANGLALTPDGRRLLVA